MTTGPYVTFTFQDWLRTPEDGLRHEVLEGEHVVTPSPNRSHQSVSVRLAYQLFGQIELTRRGHVFHAPFGVRLSDGDIVEPDLLVVLAARSTISKETHVDGPPDLVVEILSRGTVRRDRGIKKRRYETFGVREYWIVDPAEKLVEQYELEAGKYRFAGSPRERICLRILPEVTVDLDEVW